MKQFHSNTGKENTNIYKAIYCLGQVVDSKHVLSHLNPHKNTKMASIYPF